MGIDLEQWRAASGMTYEDLAKILKCSVVHARRLAIGENQMSYERFLLAQEAAGGTLDQYAIHLRRQAWLKAFSPGKRGEGMDLIDDVQTPCAERVPRVIR